jgi:hypothetical protein
MIVRTPGIGCDNAREAPIAGAQAGRVGIVLSRRGKKNNDPTTSWYPGPTFDVLMIEDYHVLRAVPLAVGGASASNIDIAWLSESDPLKVQQLETALGGGDTMPSLTELGGSPVIVDFLAMGQPVIKSGAGLLMAGIPPSKIADGAANPGEASPHSVDDFDALLGSREISMTVVYNEDTPASTSDPDLLNETAGNLVALQGTIPGGLRFRPRVPTPTVAVAGGQLDDWREWYEIGWIDGIINAFQAESTRIDPSNRQQVLAIRKADISATLRDAYLTAFKRADEKGVAYKLAHPPAPAVPASATPLDATPVNPSPADKEGDGGAVPATGAGAERYIEHGGNRIVLLKNGTTIIDSRDGGGPIMLQAGNGGVQQVAAGASWRVGKNGRTLRGEADRADVVADAVNLGSEGLVPNDGVLTGLTVDPATGLTFASIGQQSTVVKARRA